MHIRIVSLMRALRTTVPLVRSHGAAALHARGLRFGLAGMAALMLTVVGYELRPAPIAMTPEITVLQSRSLLSDIDRSVYPAIFDAQAAGDSATVDTLIPQVENPLLLGYVLANRYLSGHYNSTPEELAEWLHSYGDHPRASNIANLARRKGVAPEYLAMISDTKLLKGDGSVFHLGRSTPPDAWYRGLRQWKQGEFTNAANSFAAVGDNSKLNSWHRSAGSYWAYRSLLRAGDTRAADTHLANAAAEPMTFYGQLALARQGKAMPVRARAPYASSTLRDDPHVLRARAFHMLGMDDAAETELRALYYKVGDSDRAGLVSVAGELGLANLQLRLATLAKLQGGEAIYGSYPAPAQMVDATRDIVSPALVLAVARQESAFHGEAGSPAGARGLMQMLPSTASHVLRHAEFDVADAEGSLIPIAKRLNDEILSAKLGASYLKMLMKERAIGDNLMKILAGYNAGPGAVANWEKTARTMRDPLLYLESIPYPETHNYVTQVLAHYWVYQAMLGQRSSSLEQLARGEWPTLS